MVFKPFSTIYLCSVPFDNTYKNQVYFSSRTEQEEYFSKRVKKTFSEYLTVRETLPDGSPRSYIKVNAGIDELRLLDINYVSYMNVNLSAKSFYAFITEMIYVNEGTTKLVIETDVYQTWLFEATLLDSFVVREHSETDDYGDNIIPEKFSIGDYVTPLLYKDPIVSGWGFLITSSAPRNASDAVGRGRLHSGIYQGLYFYYFTSPNEVNSCLDDIEANKSDSIVSISCIAPFCVGNSEIDDNGYVSSTISPASKTINIEWTADALSFDGYVPKNKKLYTSPYFQILVTNSNGDEREYAVEDMGDWLNATSFKVYGDVSVSPSVAIVPSFYKGVSISHDYAISLGGFPQCSFNSDTFKLWYAKNAGKLQVSGVSSALTGLVTVGSAALTLANPLAGGAARLGAYVMGATGAIRSATTTAQNIAEVKAQSKEANKMHTGNASNNLLSAMGQNDFKIYVKRMKNAHAKMIDDYFTMYGYQTNRVKKPNVSSRTYYNYVQTEDINISGGIPSDDMVKLKEVYNNGVTLWKPYATIGDYSVDNTA